MSQNSLILMKYAINYLSKYSSSKANLEIILKKKVGRLKIEKKDKYVLYNSIENIIKDLEKNNFINDYNYTLSKIALFFHQGKSRMFIKSYFQEKRINKDIIFQENKYAYLVNVIFPRKHSRTNTIAVIEKKDF